MTLNNARLLAAFIRDEKLTPLEAHAFVAAYLADTYRAADPVMHQRARDAVLEQGWATLLLFHFWRLAYGGKDTP